MLSIETKSDSGGSPPRCQVFMLSTQKFQTPFDPKAVLDRVTSAIAYPVTIPPDDKGYRQPARGTTIFPFRFQLPQDTGSAVECGEEVRTRYTLTGYAKVRIQGNFETLVQSVEVFRLLINVDCRLTWWNNCRIIIYIAIQIMSIRS